LITLENIVNIKSIPGNVFAFILVALLIVAIVVLVCLGHPIPSIFETLAYVLVGGGASLPGLSGLAGTPVASVPAAALATLTPDPVAAQASPTVPVAPQASLVAPTPALADPVAPLPVPVAAAAVSPLA
jgi:hypothetical protein